MASNTKDKDYLTTHEAAKLLGISIRTAQIWANKGILRSWQTPGGHKRIVYQDVEKLLAERRQVLSIDHPINEINLLVIEDDPVLIQLYEGWSETCNLPINLFTAMNGFEGLIQSGICKPDVIISDLIMPKMDGFEMLQAMAESKDLQNAKVIVITSLSENEIKQRGSLPKNITLMHKPIALDVIEQALQKLISTKKCKVEDLAISE
jgi:excisionase family DNA binding protein